MTHLVKACCVRSRSQDASRRATMLRRKKMARTAAATFGAALPLLLLPPRRLPPLLLPVTLARDVVENDSFVCYHRATQIPTDACRSLQRNALRYNQGGGPTRRSGWNGHSVSLSGLRQWPPITSASSELFASHVAPFVWPAASCQKGTQMPSSTAQNASHPLPCPDRLPLVVGIARQRKFAPIKISIPAHN